MRKSYTPMFARLLLLFTMLLTSTQLFANAGKLVFVSGNVTATDADGNSRSLSRGEQVYQGDTIITGRKSMAQIRMSDRAFISMRAKSEFRIDEFVIGKDKNEDRSLFSLLRGGLRAVTGIIGKRNRDAYRLRTQVATIGIRGTDFSARLCQQDCKSGFDPRQAALGTVRDGLYLGVLDGGINIANELGTLDIDRLQYAFVAPGEAPKALLKAPDFLLMKTSGPRTDEDDDDSTADAAAETKTSEVRSSRVGPPPGDISNDQSIATDLVVDNDAQTDAELDDANTIDFAGETPAGGTVDLIDGDLNTRRAVAIGTSAFTADTDFTGVDQPITDTVVVDGSGGLSSFEGRTPGGATVLYSVGSSSNVNLGYDPVTGISWGRWAGGTSNAGATNLGLVNSSLHWVAGPDVSGSAALPSSGSASYALIGNTSPTDDAGNTGVLGNATLDADFVNMTADTSVTVGINNQVWNGAGNAMPITTNGTFGGTMNVDVDASFNGTGSASGFFTPGADGAGMSFNMEADTGVNTTVTGTAIFQKQ